MPVIKRLKESGRYFFVTFDYDLNPSYVKKYQIKSVPTYLVKDDDGGILYRTHRIEDLE